MTDPIQRVCDYSDARRPTEAERRMVALAASERDRLARGAVTRIHGWDVAWMLGIDAGVVGA